MISFSSLAPLSADEFLQRETLQAQPGFKPVVEPLSARLYDKISQGNPLERFMGGVESIVGSTITAFMPGEDNYGNTHNYFTGKPISAVDARYNHIAGIGGLLVPGEEGLSGIEKAVTGGVRGLFKRFPNEVKGLGSDLPYSARSMRQALEERYGAGNVTSSTVPPFNGKNVRLAGGSHPVTGVVFDSRGFPIFDDVAAYDTRLPIDQFRSASYTGQMRMATQDLAAAIERGEVPATQFTPEQLMQIESGSPTINGYTWHHYQETGRMQLVPRDIHAQTGHVGWEGMSEGL